jgi:hypothetical protein
MVLFVGIMIIAGGITYPLYDQAHEDVTGLNKLSGAREAANALANALNSLYAGGPGSKQTIEYWLPEGAVNMYVHVDGDGIEASDGIVPLNGRIDVQVLLDFDGDGAWDNTRDSVVLADTLLPSRWYENGDSRDNNWVIENCIGIQDWNFKYDSTYRTHHRVTLEYKFEPVIAEWEFLWSAQLDEGEKAKFKTTLFGIKLKVEAENEGNVMEAELEFGDDEAEQEAPPPFTLEATSDNVTVRVDVSAGYVEVRYSATLTEFPYPKRILVSDVIMERA